MEAVENVHPTFNVKSARTAWLMVLAQVTSVLKSVSIASPTDNAEIVLPMLIVVLWMEVKSLPNRLAKPEFA
jgi:uncharacterized membrane protein